MARAGVFSDGTILFILLAITCSSVAFAEEDAAQEVAYLPPDSVLTLDHSNFSEMVKKHKFIVVEFYAYTSGSPRDSSDRRCSFSSLFSFDLTSFSEILYVFSTFFWKAEPRDESWFLLLLSWLPISHKLLVQFELKTRRADAGSGLVRFPCPDVRIMA
ncbi:unnamed protein product [Victoria cruziana]